MENARKPKSNKALGSEFEAGLCRYLRLYGIWASRFQQSAEGQPVDIIACGNDVASLIDCKTCLSGRFVLSRIEPNQEHAMKDFIDSGANRGAWFALWFGRSEVWMIRYLDIDKARNHGRKEVTLSSVREDGGIPLEEWVKDKEKRR